MNLDYTVKIVRGEKGWEPYKFLNVNTTFQLINLVVTFNLCELQESVTEAGDRGEGSLTMASVNRLLKTFTAYMSL